MIFQVSIMEFHLVCIEHLMIAVRNDTSLEELSFATAFYLIAFYLSLQLHLILSHFTFAMQTSPHFLEDDLFC